MDDSLEFVCSTYEFYVYQESNSVNFAFYYILALVSVYLRLFRHLRERIPLTKLLCTEANIFILAMVALSTWNTMLLTPTMREESLKFEWNTRTASEFLRFVSTFHINQPYFIGLCMVLILLRAFYSLRVTRSFGPFIKLISLSFLNLIIWSLLSFICILVMADFLLTLLQEN